VATANYQKDDKGQDPSTISANWLEDSLRIDLTNPFINSVHLLFNDAYPGIYDMIYEANGYLNTDLSYLTISEKTSKFSTISNLNPRSLQDSLYHIASSIGGDVKTATIELNMDLRDQAQNSGSWKKSAYYASVSPDAETIIESPSGIAAINIQPGVVLTSTPIFVLENDPKDVFDRKTDSHVILSPEVYLICQSEFLTPARIEFRPECFIEESISQLQLVILHEQDFEWTELESSHDGETVSAAITSAGTYVLAGKRGVKKETPSHFSLKPNFPNPFNPSTVIPVEMPEAAHLKAVVYDLLGREVAVLANEVFKAGYHNLTWRGDKKNGKSAGSGIYLLQIESGGELYSVKMVLMK
ncbi:MAG: T9SS type A sorting domain-containing protein, partial [Candidatus Marinimicrobia bacterium]|nr:T9SS type A sorting domain-containing protein [Candidatus Neomarinimicrobiota bacterium]